MSHTPRIFISYSHDSDQHRAFVLSVANRLRAGGLDCQLDQYVNGFPPEGWQRWMETQIEQADFVLVVCTPLYLQRYRGLATDGGRGVNFEGVVISQTLYDHYYRNTKFIPVMPECGSLEDVPLPLKGYSVYTLMADYTKLYRVLTGQPVTPAPEMGERVVLGEEAASPYSPSPALPPQGVKGAKHSPGNQQGKTRMSDTLKAGWIGAVAVLIGALITVMAMLWGNNKEPATLAVPVIQQNISNSQGTQTQVGGDLVIGDPQNEASKP